MAFFVIFGIVGFFVWLFWYAIQLGKKRRELYNKNLARLGQLNVIEKRTAEEETEKLKLEDWFKRSANAKLADDIAFNQYIWNSLNKKKK
jgi:hypothetical protein